MFHLELELSGTVGPTRGGKVYLGEASSLYGKDIRLRYNEREPGCEHDVGTVELTVI